MPRRRRVESTSASDGEQAHRELLAGHLEGEERHRAVLADRGVAREVQQQRGLTDAGARRQITRSPRLKPPSSVSRSMKPRAHGDGEQPSVDSPRILEELVEQVAQAV